MHRIRSGCKRLSSLPSIRRCPGFLSINYVRSNGQDGKGRLCIPVQLLLFQLLKEQLYLLFSDTVYPIIIISVGRILSLHLIVCDQPGLFITDASDFAYLIAERESARTLKPAIPNA